MKKFILIILLTGVFSSASSQALNKHINEPSHFDKGSSNFGFMVLPFPFKVFSASYGQFDFTSSLSYSYFLFKNTEVSISAKYGYYRFFDDNYLSELNLVVVNPYIRYYFLKSKLFVELDYVVGTSKERGQYNISGNINNPGFGFGFRRTFYFKNEKLSNNFSLELSRKRIIGTPYAPLLFYAKETRLAIIYHF